MMKKRGVGRGRENDRSKKYYKALSARVCVGLDKGEAERRRIKTNFLILSLGHRRMEVPLEVTLWPEPGGSLYTYPEDLT